jgi:hypothetical protein
MTTIKISQLPDASVPLTGTEVFPLNQAGVTKKVSIQNAFALKVANFYGNGSQVAFVMPSSISENATSVFINGVYQQKNTYSVATNTITFSQAPPFTSSIEVMYA